MPRPRQLLPPYLPWLLLVAAGIALIYAPSLGSPLFFDDELLLSGELFRLYGALEIRERLLSYGSFVWVQALAGEGWWKQRLVNVALHMAVVVGVWSLYRELIRHVTSAEAGSTGIGDQPGAAPALLLATGFFALNPVAVYGVAYLIQRSILLATLFVVLGLWCVARASTSRPPAAYIGLALLCYALAIASKEHAVFAPLAAAPVHILAARPAGRRLAAVAGILLAVGGIGVGALLWRYGALVGKPFDAFSQTYLQQLAQLAPDAVARAWPLSIMNQAYLFFEYGLRWALPWNGWLSVNLRPVFPVSFFTFPHLLGPFAYLAVLAGGSWLLLRYRDMRALAGVSLLVPTLLFPTEFATVWVQDPFVLYRSYLWAIGIPGLVFAVVYGLGSRTLGAVALVAGALLGWQSLDRVFSMATPERLYTDAIAKLPNDPRSVGRWFPYLNRGNVYFDANQLKLAEQDFRASSALGDGGMGVFNIGSIRQRTGDPQGALAAYAEAERLGYKLFNLPMQRGVAYASLGRAAEAYEQLQAAMTMNPTREARHAMTQQMGRLAFQLGRHDEAIQHAKAILADDKRNREAGYLLATSLIAKRDFATAARLLTIMISEAPEAGLHFSRAMAFYGLQQKARALADIDQAMRMGLDNPAVRDWEKNIRAMP